MPSLTFRKALNDDVDDIFVALRTLATEQGLKDRFTLSREKLQGVLFSNQAFAEALLARVDDKLAGLALFSPTNRNFDFFERPGLYLHDLYILQAFRRQGIGTQLIDNIKEIAKARNCCRIDWAMLKTNSIGAQFYKAIRDAKEVDYINYMRITV